MASEDAKVERVGRAAAWLAVLGATLGPVLDGFHTWSGTTWYTSPGWMRSVWWCPPVFSFAALAIGLLRPILEARASPARSLTLAGNGRLAAATAIFVGAYAASAFLPTSSTVKCAVLVVLAAGGWWALDRTSVGLLHGAIAAAGGWLAEFALVRAGLFVHRTGELAGVAVWLPFLYFCSATAIGMLGSRLIMGRRVLVP